MLQSHDASLELVYSPENLRLGEAIACYLRPGHVIVGCDDADAGASVAELFAVLDARVVIMDLPSAEMAKHCINTFLATSVTLANHWADLCARIGADYAAIAEAIKLDPRIGSRAYVGPGLGFSGGTLGRDLKVLESVSSAVGVDAPLFGTIWEYNARRPRIVARIAEEMLGSLVGRTVGVLGMTYKPGTSTLNRSIAVEVALDLAACDASLQVYDPMADWSEMPSIRGFRVCASALQAATGSDLLLLLTDWSEFRELDLAGIASAMNGTTLLDMKGVLRGRVEELQALGLDVYFLGVPRRENQGRA
jgi:UDPglucose 6-dehydrogenase